VLAFRNPGTADHELTRATDTLCAAIQMVLPGEVAPPHRHTPAALRFIIEGAGA
jgi:gentisate 1,2-dioxygenase